MGLHVDKSERLLEKNYEHSAGNPVLIEAVFVHVRFLRKRERRVLKAYSHAQISTCQIQPSKPRLGPSLAILALKKCQFFL